MKKIKIIGSWKDFRPKSICFLSDQINLDKFLEEEIIKNELRVFINYLSNGLEVSSDRTISYCPITGEEIGTPIVFTDGDWIWTSEYIYYL